MSLTPFLNVIQFGSLKCNKYGTMKKHDDDIRQKRAVSNGFEISDVKIALRYLLTQKLIMTNSDPNTPPITPRNTAPGMI